MKTAAATSCLLAILCSSVLATSHLKLKAPKHSKPLGDPEMRIDEDGTEFIHVPLQKKLVDYDTHRHLVGYGGSEHNQLLQHGEF